ncbi:MAG: Protein phosphatase PP2A regulatory subunit B [Piccolia ochrophora]|nr:MAG: Protein phosphatase PP2A regulatory subunit B [Piccolia ochrophora]
MADEGTLKVLIIDHYDSYTNNILQLLQGFKINSKGVKYPEWNAVVIRFDQFTWAELQETVLPEIDAIILSPGPGRSDRIQDFGFNEELLRTVNIPVLGICLGHQGIGTAYGQHIIGAPDIKHGQVSEIFHNDRGILKALPQGFTAVRYNSLLLDEKTLPPELQTIAWTSDAESPGRRITMAVQHKTRPLFGMQWHPESVCSTHGLKIVMNFREIVHDYWKTSSPYNNWTSRPINEYAELPDRIRRSSAISNDIITPPRVDDGLANNETASDAPYFVKAITLGQWSVARDVFESFVLGKSLDGEAWLDSAKHRDSHSRNSYMASASAVINYSTKSQKLEFIQNNQVTRALTLDEGFWNWLDNFQSTVIQANTESLPAEKLGQQAEVGQPILQVGLIGYLGYELKRESLPGYSNSPQKGEAESSKSVDSQLQFADRVLWLDNETGDWKVLGLIRRGDADPIGDVMSVNRPLGIEESVFDDWATNVRRDFTSGITPRSIPPGDLPTFVSKDDRPSYSAHIAAAKRAIQAGETYELTMTTRFEARSSGQDPYSLYLALRLKNPAPYSGYLSFPYLELAILSSSPERFLSVDRNKITEMKPIKGTLAVSPDKVENERRKLQLASDKKELAENLMIVDLIRSDLHNICSSTSINVETLMQVESYETVHQLVTTIQGRVAPSIGSVKVIESCFPPGSMTGAPKLRSVQILEELEQHEERGIYSGSLGYFCASGTVDQSVVIRTIVSEGDKLTLGAGGAITWLSDPTSEWEEVLVKANALTEALPRQHTPPSPEPVVQEKEARAAHPTPAPSLPPQPTGVVEVEHPPFSQAGPVLDGRGLIAVK